MAAPHVEARDAAGRTWHLPVDAKGFAGEELTIASATALAYQDMGPVLGDPAFPGLLRDAPVPAGDRIFRLPYLDPQGRMTIMQWNTASFGTDYRQINHRRVDPERVREFYGGEVVSHSFPHGQELDRAGLRGRLLSSSYTPREGNPDREPMLRALDEIFDRHARAGTVRIEYDTELYVGTLR